MIINYPKNNLCENNCYPVPFNEEKIDFFIHNVEEIIQMKLLINVNLMRKILLKLEVLIK